jgi:outer membrane protein
MRMVNIVRIPLFLFTLLIFLPNPADAQDSSWQFRLRGIAVVPDESATVDGDDVMLGIDNAFVPELDISYVFSPNVSVELILATTKHDVTVADGDVDLGSIWLLPPTVLLQYRFAPEAQVRPYLGAGVNMTVFYNEDLGVDISAIDYDTAIGFALQGGVDIPLGDGNWFLNLDAKKLFLGTDVTVDGGDIVADVTIDPWVFGAGFGLTVQ